MLSMGPSLLESGLMKFLYRFQQPCSVPVPLHSLEWTLGIVFGLQGAGLP
jgi:hypothetical protein